jgi:hypothetical protein
MPHSRLNCIIEEADEIKNRFTSIKVNHYPRHQNRAADLLCQIANKGLICWKRWECSFFLEKGLGVIIIDNIKEMHHLKVLNGTIIRNLTPRSISS